MARDVEMVDSSNKQALAELIISRLGQNVEFTNGCFLSLIEDSGLYWGTDPYGSDWGCNADSDFVAQVTGWLAFWDDPRDEQGRLIDADYLYADAVAHPSCQCEGPEDRCVLCSDEMGHSDPGQHPVVPVTASLTVDEKSAVIKGLEGGVSDLDAEELSLVDRFIAKLKSHMGRGRQDKVGVMKIEGQGQVSSSDEYPPCSICGGANDVGEVCIACSADNDPFGTDLETSGGWMAQSGRDR